MGRDIATGREVYTDWDMPFAQRWLLARKMWPWRPLYAFGTAMMFAPVLFADTGEVAGWSN